MRWGGRGGQKCNAVAAFTSSLGSRFRFRFPLSGLWRLFSVLVVSCPFATYFAASGGVCVNDEGDVHDGVYVAGYHQQDLRAHEHADLAAGEEGDEGHRGGGEGESSLMYCTILYFTVLYCTLLYYTIL